MRTADSKDGTTLAFDAVGSGPPLVIVGGAFSFRRWKGTLQLVELLKSRFTVVNYDRRGRGDSTDAKPYAVEREFEDLQAVVDAVGGSAFAWGMSSGGVLALRAAGAGVSIEKLAMYLPPFVVDTTAHVPPADFEARLSALVEQDRRSDAAKLFMTQGMGAPGIAVGLMRLARPMWSRLKAVAHTLPNDLAVMGDTVYGKPLLREPWASIATPTLVIDGGKSPASLQKAADALAGRLPQAQRRTLEGQHHNVSMKVLAPVLQDWFVR